MNKKKEAELENTAAAAARYIAKKEVCLDISVLILSKRLPLCGCR